MAEKLGFHIAVGLIILGIEELGKYVLLDEAIANIEDPKETLEIPVGIFKSHRIKLEKGTVSLQELGN